MSSDSPENGPRAAGGAHSVLAGPEDAGERLDRFLAARLPELSRARVQALIKAGLVRSGGRTLVEPSGRVNSGEITVEIPPAAPAAPAPERIPLAVAYEDEHLIVIDKPAGLVVHPAAGHADGTLVNALLAHCGSSLSGVGGVARPGIVHRLDKDTSGLMVVAKTDRAHRGLAAQFADHGRSGPLRRAYLAFVWGAPGRPRGTVDAPLGRSARNREKIAIREDGRRAVTHWDALEQFAGGAVTLLECRLETGRTHQIRVHMASMGHPLLGDGVYGSGFRTKAARLDEAGRAAFEGLGRQALHAAELGFEHPQTGEALVFRSALPPDLRRLATALGWAG